MGTLPCREPIFRPSLCPSVFLRCRPVRRSPFCWYLVTQLELQADPVPLAGLGCLQEEEYVSQPDPPTPPPTCRDAETLTDVCNTADLPEVEIISLLEEQLRFTGYAQTQSTATNMTTGCTRLYFRQMLAST
ncbi:hypothetical protein UPYG_G00335540 [Umbra pygmaea]|uniref:Uncharacterized protein n=1 Tax=Umbra pygmaea TaxID=75934 RepID=A0ABD0WCA7_UMBPY